MEQAKKAISAVIGYRIETVDGGIFLNRQEAEALGHFLITGQRAQVKEAAPARPAIRKPAAPAARPGRAVAPVRRDPLEELEAAARKAASETKF